jgi:hypothetical protein
MQETSRFRNARSIHWLHQRLPEAIPGGDADVDDAVAVVVGGGVVAAAAAGDGKLWMTSTPSR